MEANDYCCCRGIFSSSSTNSTFSSMSDLAVEDQDNQFPALPFHDISLCPEASSVYREHSGHGFPVPDILHKTLQFRGNISC